MGSNPSRTTTSMKKKFFLFCDRTLLGEQLSDPLNFSNSTHVPLVAIMEFITATSSQEVSIDIKMFVLTNYVFNI